MNDPLVSVVIACFNGAEYLEDCVRSVLDQNASCEIIVVDDGSTDASVELARELLRQAPAEMFVLSQKNQGPAAARNAGVRVARGKYLCFLDVDDRYAPGFFASTVPILEKEPGVVGVFSEIEMVNAHRPVESWQREAMERTLPSNMLMRMEAVRQVGGFPEHPAFRGPAAGEDGAFRNELRRYGRLAKVSKPLLKYRVRAGSHFDFFLDRAFLENNGRVGFRWLSPEEKDGSLQSAVRGYRDVVHQRALARTMEPLQTSAVASFEFHRLSQRFEAIEGRLHPAEGYTLYCMARRWPVEGKVVEVGCFKGRATCWLAAGCRDSKKSSVVAVDHVHGSSDHTRNGSRLDHDPALNGSARTAFRGNIEQLQLAEWVTARSDSSAEANTGWEGPIRLLLIDGEASDEVIREDFAAWSRFVALHGLVVFQDVGVFPAVTQIYGELCAEARGWKELARFRNLGILERTGKDSSNAAKLEAAAIRLREVLRQHPDQADSLFKLAQLLERQKAWDESIAAYRQLLHVSPEHADAHNFLGILLARQQCFDEAMEHFRTFLKMEPKRAAGYHNMGVACADREMVAEAIPHFDDALRIDPEHAEAHKGKSMALLKLGHFREGWAEYEWRWRCKDLVPLRSPRPQWDGSALEGKTILLHSEQGIGDTLQFIRYAARVKNQGGNVILACPAPLIPLLRTCPGIDRLVSRKSSLPPHEVHIPLLSLPRVFRTELASIPHEIPYLHADPARVRAWRTELAGAPAFKIGIVWQGNPKHLNDANRSIPLSQFQPLAEVPGVRLYSLQIGKGTEQLSQFAGKFEVTDLQKKINGAFVETAAVMKNLDLTICCDTSVAHLAGALGLPVWVALPFAADWRWLQEREGSPWYPTMRLFRQTRMKDWQEVFQRMTEALKVEVQRPRVFSADTDSEIAYSYPEHAYSDPAEESLSGRMDAPAPIIEPALQVSPLGIPPATPQTASARKLIRSRKYPEAEQALREVLSDDPSNADAWLQLALAQQAQNRLPNAVDSFRRLLRLRPEYADGHASLGIAFCRLGQKKEGEASLREAIRLQPNLAKAHNNLGVVLGEMGKRAEALACWQETVRLDPNYPEGHFNIAVGLAENKQLDDAAQSYEHALQLRPDYAEAYSNLGMLRVEQGRPGDAVVLLEHALRLKPDFVDAHNNLGLALADLGRSEEAMQCYREALRRRPKYAEVYNNFGTAHAAMGRFDEALACFAQALRLKPGYPEARWHQALTWLHQGDFVRGWPEYEWRWKRKRARPRRLQEPLWDGANLEGKTILLWCEQGLGDSLQFIRYAPLVKARGGNVLVECPEKLLPMFFTCPGIDQVVPERSQLPAFDVHAPLLSLPGILGTRLHTIPDSIPYLSADPARVEKWREDLCADTVSKKLRIGIVWRGNPKHRWDRHRSFSLECFQELARLDGVQLYSLQKGVPAEDLAHCSRRHSLIDLAGRLDDFTDTAAVMRNLDLVISCDSAPAHLAGALGVPVWVALSAMCDWRWLTQRDDTPWYPTMKLFRQKSLGDWNEVFSRLIQEVTAVRSAASP